jgi:hypothetical protein
VIRLAWEGHHLIEDCEAVTTSIDTTLRDAEGFWKTTKSLGLLITVSLSPERPAQQQTRRSNL